MKPLVINANLGESIHHMTDGSVRHFRPTGPTYLVDNNGGLHPIGGKSAEAPARRKEIELLPSGGLSARLFVGLNVGAKPTYKLEQVIQETIKIRKRQKALPDASFLTQKGVYTQGKGAARRIIEEDSVQIILIDTVGTPQDVFEKELKALGVHLCKHFKQDSVILEIQRGGVVQASYSIKA